MSGSGVRQTTSDSVAVAAENHPDCTAFCAGEEQSEIRQLQLEAEVTRKIVADRINSLDDGFLGGLEAYSMALRRSNQEELAGECFAC